MSPLISIVVPVYNAEKYISGTLDSILAQTINDIEIVCVDDGSKDNSPEILDEFAVRDSRVKVIHKQNEGVTIARLTGIKSATGEYIGFIDSDDTIEPDMFERLYNNVIKHNADISHCGYKLIKPDNEVKYFYNTGRLIRQDKTKGLYDLLEGSYIEPGLWNKLFHKSLFHSLLHAESVTSVMDFSMKNNEDLLMNYCLFSQAKSAVYEDFCPYNYFVRENSASKGKTNIHKLLDPIKAARIIYNDLKGNNKLSGISSQLYAVKLIQTATCFAKDDIVKPARKEALKELRKFIPELLKISGCSKNTKIKATWAALSPGTYNLIHKLYLKKQ